MISFKTILSPASLLLGGKEEADGVPQEDKSAGKINKSVVFFFIRIVLSSQAHLQLDNVSFLGPIILMPCTRLISPFFQEREGVPHQREGKEKNFFTHKGLPPS